MADRSAKRKCTATNGCSVGLVSVTPLRIMVELLEGILTTIEMKVDCTAGCIRVMSMDPAGVCVATAKLVCGAKMLGKGDNTTFTISSLIMKTCLKTLNAYHSIDLIYDSEAVAAKLLLIAYEVSSSSTTRFQLPVLDIQTKPIPSFNMEYEFTLEMELNTLRNITKNAILLKGDEIQFTVSTNAKYIELTIFTDGGAEQEHSFYARKNATSSNPVRIDDAAEIDDHALRDMGVRYKHRFSVAYMNKFLQAESQVISLRLSKGKPLILNYPLGVDDSYVSFVLSPRAAEVDH